MNVSRRRYMGAKSGGLPSGYTQVGSITSNGTVWIDTGKKITLSTVLEFEGNIVDVSYTGYLYGRYTNNDGTFYMYSTAYIQVAFGSGYKNTTHDTDTLVHKYKLYIDTQSRCEIDDVLVWSNSIKTPLSANNVYVCGTATTIAKAFKTNYVKIYENGVLVRDYIPCVRDSDNVASMFDLVSNTFVEPSGTGYFSPNL